MGPNPQFPVDLVTFPEEILNWKLHFMCSESFSKHLIYRPYPDDCFWSVHIVNCLIFSFADVFSNFVKYLVVLISYEIPDI